MHSSSISAVKGSYEQLRPMAAISLGVILAFGWVAMFVWLLLKFLVA
jgi:hypothetical protein